MQLNLKQPCLSFYELLGKKNLFKIKSDVIRFGTWIELRTVYHSIIISSFDKHENKIFIYIVIFSQQHWNDYVLKNKEDMIWFCIFLDEIEKMN